MAQPISLPTVPPTEIEAVLKQRLYYEKSAVNYDALHLDKSEHHAALTLLREYIAQRGYKSVLDVGSGTGRALLDLREGFPHLRLTGIEPVKAMRELGHAKGVPVDELIDGDANALPAADGSYDIVCAFGVLHHLAQPRRALEEMLRVARHAVFISDMNSFGMGSLPSRLFKLVASRLRLTGLVTRVQSGGKPYRETPDDGIWYTYSLFQDYAWLSRRCRSIQLATTHGGNRHPLLQASHLALLALKD